MRAIAAAMIVTLSTLSTLCRADVTTTVVDIALQRPGVTQRILYVRPDKPSVNVVLLPGSDGTLAIQDDGTMLSPAGLCNPVGRNRQAFADHGYSLALVDNASDGSVWKTADVLGVVQYMLQHDDVPVWIIGASSSTQPTTAIVTELPASLSLGMIVFSPDVPDPVVTARVRRPSGVIYNPLDTGQAAGSYYLALTSAPIREVTSVSGGRSTACGYHLFQGLDAQFVAAIESFVDRYTPALGPLAVPFGTTVEFYNAGLDHYFISHVANEIALLDAGTTIKGWARTGQSFNVYAASTPGASPVCRFYIPPEKGNSHFYGRGTTECDGTAAANPSFVNEDPQFFYIVLPAAGTCPAGTRNVYRVFSNRADANHRYVVDRTIRDQMVARGWLAEGDGADLVVMCSPS